MKVKLEIFEGPLDLLLYLIKKNHINVSDIPIAIVLGQYLEYLEFLKLLDINIASEYLVMAATLIQIKSRMLLPRPEEEAQEEEVDPREELVNKLLEYQKYKDIANSLRDKELHRIKFLRRPDSLLDYKPEEVYFEASIFDLITAFKSALKDVPKEIFFEVIKDEFTVEQKIHDILHLLLVDSVIELGQLFLKAKNKLEVVATFLAILELIRLKEIGVFQEGLFGKIIITRNNQ
ncbi:MAG: segregation/condensation protein A [Candidatus Omnitrophica bacterium]|nr:segregation/condensation protein A [Candidatus Omnitrophota bacterium]